jgi:hypothetical protein
MPGRAFASKRDVRKGRFLAARKRLLLPIATERIATTMNASVRDKTSVQLALITNLVATVVVAVATGSAEAVWAVRLQPWRSSVAARSCADATRPAY